MSHNKERKMDRRDYFDSVAQERIKWRNKAWYFYRWFTRYLKFLIPENTSVLEIGCETGDTLSALRPCRGLGIDCSPKMIDLARKKFPGLEFKIGEIDNLDSLDIRETFDYVIIGSVIGYVNDIQVALSKLKKVCRPDTRVVVVYYNYLWEPILRFAEVLGLRMKRPLQHWFSGEDFENFLDIEGFDVIKKKNYFLVPFYVPLVSSIINKYLANLFLIRSLSLVQIVVARLPQPRLKAAEIACSVIVPCRNEKGNIEQDVLRIPEMGKSVEIIFVEGHSKDGTLEECERVIKKYSNKKVKVFVQEGEGKADAVRKGFSCASGDVLMILDADLTVPPEELSKFFNAIVSGKGEFINGSRLVYKMEDRAMRFLNVLGNKFFSAMFTFLLEQYIKDTLCGTKVLWRSDYENIVKGRGYFGDFDPFGDFDLLFGASKLNLKITEIPIHYRERTYGSTQIRRFSHGWLLLKMTFFAMNKIKFI